MGRATNIIIAVVVAAGGWYAYSSYVNRIKNGPQGDPTRAVQTFMNTAQTFSGLLWNSDVREQLRSDLDAWEKASEEGDAEMPESLKQLGIEDPRPLFADERLGKATLATISLFHFDSYSVDRTDVRKNNTATVYVSFVPYDFMGMRQALSGMGGQQSVFQQKPVDARFELKKHWHAWKIEELGGEASDLTRAFRRLGR
jgi:hypothetical protein